MATTKKILEDEFGKQATTFDDVNNQDSKTRLMQSLQTSYGQAIDESNKAYDQNYNATDRASVGRGMQRSSYNMQTLANINTQKAQAADKLRQNMIADYQNRLTSLEQQELENERWEREFEANRADAAWQQEFSTKQWEAQQAQWREEFDYNKMTTDQQIAYNYIMNMLESGDNPSDELLKRAGISRSDYNQMKATPAAKTASRGGYNPPPGTNDDPAWKTAGFQSEKDYNEAKSHGLKTAAELTAYREKLVAMRKAGSGGTGATEKLNTSRAYTVK